ncbi:MAG: energy transducer TonB [Dokdonella sp.]
MMSSTFASRAQRGAAAPKLVLIVLLTAGVAGAAWFFTQRGGPDGTVATTTTTAAAPGEVATPAEVVTIAPEVEVLSVGQLFAAARTALAEQRMVMPAGNNALEYYLAILEKEPGNSGASEALRELFPFASGTAEQEIASGSVDEAARIIAQLAKADPENYTLTILRNKLDVRRKTDERELATQAAATAAAARAATQPNAVAPAPPIAPTATVTSPVPEPATASATAVVPPPAAAPATTPVPAPSSPTPAAVAQPTPVAQQPASSADDSDASVTSAASLSYPQQAARNRVEGWVEVEFTVTAEGQVQGARVLRSDPPRVFDREAIRSIERSTYRARIENGTPVNATLRRRIEFKLDG